MTAELWIEMSGICPRVSNLLQTPSVGAAHISVPPGRGPRWGRASKGDGLGCSSFEGRARARPPQDDGIWIELTGTCSLMGWSREMLVHALEDRIMRVGSLFAVIATLL